MFKIFWMQILVKYLILKNQDCKLFSVLCLLNIYFWDMLYYSTIYVGYLTTVSRAFIKISKDAIHLPPMSFSSIYLC